MSQEALQRLLLDLLSSHRTVTQSDLDVLSDADWAQLLELAHQHRLHALLHWQFNDKFAALVVPETVRARCADVFQRGTLRALAVQRALVQAVRLLDAAGIPCIALKGAFLAFGAYPQPALRPLRDLDLLVTRHQALAAYAALVSAGFTRSDNPDDYSPEGCLTDKKHLPPLRDPGAMFSIELHTRVTLPEEGEAGGFEGTGLWMRRITRQFAGQEIAYLSGTDLLLHLIYHAAYDHHLENGPLTLVDIAWLLRTTPIDWPRFWQQAHTSGWTRGSLLLLALTRHYFEDAEISFEGVATDEVAEATRYAQVAAPLIARPPFSRGTKFAISLAGKSPWQSLANVAGRVLPSRSTLAAQFPEARGAGGLALAYARNIVRALTVKLPRVVRDAHKSSARRQRRQALELEHWLRPG